MRNPMKELTKDQFLSQGYIEVCQFAQNNWHGDLPPHARSHIEQCVRSCYHKGWTIQATIEWVKQTEYASPPICVPL